ncbi:MAG: hypothetical protein AAGH78_01855 [Cyanobacteria bacterium P01_H01_bin.58]
MRPAIQSTAVVKPVAHQPILGIEALRGLVVLVAQFQALDQASPDHPREATSCLSDESPPALQQRKPSDLAANSAAQSATSAAVDESTGGPETDEPPSAAGEERCRLILFLPVVV